MTRAKNAADRRFVISCHGYRGIYRRANRPGWYARIWHEGELHYGGRHETKELAAAAYDKLARRFHGHDAVLNFPQGK